LRNHLACRGDAARVGWFPRHFRGGWSMPPVLRDPVAAVTAQGAPINLQPLGLDRLPPPPGDGASAAQGPHFAIRRLADDPRICRCNCVTKGAVVAAIRAGHCSVEALGQSTCAGTGCGSCHAGLRKLLVAYLSEAATSPRTRLQEPTAVTPPPKVGTTLLAV